MTRQTKLSIALTILIVLVLTFLVFVSVPDKYNNKPGFWLEERR